MPWIREEVEAKRMDEGNAWAWDRDFGWMCDSEVLGGVWKDCSFDKAVS